MNTSQSHLAAFGEAQRSERRRTVKLVQRLSMMVCAAGVSFVRSVGGNASADLVTHFRADQGVLNTSDNPASVGENVKTWQDQSANVNDGRCLRG